MNHPNGEKTSDFHRHCAIRCNNEFWDMSERETSPEEKQQLLTLAHASLFHWQEAGTEENIQLANLAVARAYCVCESAHCIHYATQAYHYFNDSGENWVQALTNAVLSHALTMSGDHKQASHHYEQADHLKLSLSEGDRKVFDATFSRIPVPHS